ncbi:MAG: acetylxylan esterase [Clostridia bacterium]|nr:acetylxylan esterase [Clostridia bacterium]MBQ9707024.1 acetylxylan esterase [Clostridia bacterium]
MMDNQVQGQGARQKRIIITLAICIAAILFATIIGSCIQTAGWSYTVEDLRNVSNSGKITRLNDAGVEEKYDVNGNVESGLLFIPKKASAENKVPAIVFTHGLYNNREMQLQNVIEMVRRGYVVLALDYGGHGHNAEEEQIDTMGMQSNYGYTPYIMLAAAKYLYNLPMVDQSKIGVSGHSMGGGATTNTLQIDGIDSTYSDSLTTGALASANDESRKAGYHLGIVSAALTQANDVTNMFGYMDTASIGSNVIAAGVLKASADEFFFSSTLKEAAYLRVSKADVDETNYTNYYLKDKDGNYVQQNAGQKFRPGKQYYTLTTSGSAYVYLNTVNAVSFVTGVSKFAIPMIPTITEYKVANGGIYVNGKLEYQPKVKVYDTLDTASGGVLERTYPVMRDLVSAQRKGEAIASATNKIRVIYEARETHPMNHFSVQSAAHVIDFFYNAFGVSPVGKYIAPSNQTWWIKEAVSIIGFIGIFGLLFPVLDLLLGTKLFASLKGEPAEGPVLLTRPRKHVTYWLSGILTAIFGAISLKNMYGDNSWRIYNDILAIFNDSRFVYNDTVARFAAWGMLCGVFGLIVSAVIWLINRGINAFVHGDEYAAHDESPFEGFKIRSWQNVLKTPLLAAILLAVFYGVINLMWSVFLVDLRFWTFDLRVFDLIRVPAMVQYLPYFFIFYMITSALSQNYRVKDLPEWATIAINVVFNVIGIVILLWSSNSYFIRTGTQIATSSLFYIAAIPIIPCVGFATVIARRMYVRTGNAWLAGIVNAVIMTFFACANTSLAIGAHVGWVLGA